MFCGLIQILAWGADMSNFVFAGTSLDGYIADGEGKLDWLDMIPNPSGDDMGFGAFMSSIDGVVMGRVTFETVLSFGVEWPYSKPVFVLSRTLGKIPEELIGRVEIIQGTPEEITTMLTKRGYVNLYIDGGKTIQNFLNDDMIDEMIITRLPILLGGGIPLFGELPVHQIFSHISTDVYLDELVCSHYKRV